MVYLLRLLSLRQVMAGVLVLSSLLMTLPALGRDPWPSATFPASFGTDVHFYGDNPREFTMMRQAGIRVLRIKMPWHVVERRRGVYDFRQYKAMVAGLRREGIRPLIMIGFGNQQYGEIMSCRTPAGRQAYARLAETAARELAGNQVIWELWNEPNLSSFWRPQSNVDEYMAWLTTVAPAIRKGDPQALIVGPALSNTLTNFMRGAFSRGIMDYVDGISVHPYQYTRIPENGLRDYVALQNVMRRTQPGTTMPIVFTEWGYSTAPGEFDEATQAKYLSRQFLLGAMYRVPINIWYNWKNSRTEPCAEKDKCYGILKNDLTARPAYTTLSQLTRELTGFQFVRRIPTKATQDFILVFQQAGGSQVKYVVWTTTAPHASPELDGILKQSAPQLTDTPQFIKGS